MKKAKIISIFTLICMLLCLASCHASDQKNEIMGNINDGGAMGETILYGQEIFGQADADDNELTGGSESIAPVMENPFIKTEVEAVSTLSADVDTASYTFLRKLINSDYSLKDIQNLAKSSVIRTEEMVNYFDYSYNDAPDGEMFGTKATVTKSPWNDQTYLLVLGLKARQIESAGANNLVFLIDVSGSMSSRDKLPLLQEAFSYLVSQLDENDTVSIVTYASDERVVLDGCSGNKKETILKAINDLSAGGSTYGEAGIKKAYELAEANFKPDGNNRIILASDGDLNVGISSPEELESLVTDKRDSGIFLSVLGFGSGNFRDANMSAIAQNGNGVYHYIDCAAEAERIFATSLLSTIYTVAKDVKFQLTFDTQYVSEYRLIGYENRLLNAEDFEDDTKDAGDVGSGQTLTVCYELRLSEGAVNAEGQDEDTAVENWIKLDMRYKEPDEATSKLRTVEIGEADLTDTPDSDIKFIGAVIRASMLIRESAYGTAESTDLNGIISTLESLELTGDKAEFLNLLKKLK